MPAGRMEGEKKPTKYWLAHLPADTPLMRLVGLAKLRWRIERDDQELKQAGRRRRPGGWATSSEGRERRSRRRGFHHHASLCLAAYGFLVRERARLSPGGKPSGGLEAPGLPTGFRPRGAGAASATARAAFDGQLAPASGGAAGTATQPLPMLRAAPASTHQQAMTQ